MKAHAFSVFEVDSGVNNHIFVVSAPRFPEKQFFGKGEGISNKERPMAYDDNNVFAKILRGEIPAKKVYEDEFALAFHDIGAKAPVHVLVIPKGKYISIADFGANASDAEITGFYRALSKVAQELDLVEKGFRSIANTGLNGGQEVLHYHVHLLGGKSIGPMVAE
jgi:histidine triad (HIT) family protein